jgi:hypothetical protein
MDSKDRAMTIRDRLWLEVCRRYFEDVREDYRVGGFPDLPSFVIHEIWKRDPRVSEVQAQLSDARAEIERLRGERDESRMLHAEACKIADESSAAQRRVEELERALREIEDHPESRFNPFAAAIARTARAPLQGTEPKPRICVRCGADYAPDGSCTNRHLGCQGGRGESAPWKPAEPKPEEPKRPRSRWANLCCSYVPLRKSRYAPGQRDARGVCQRCDEAACLCGWELCLTCGWRREEHSAEPEPQEGLGSSGYLTVLPVPTKEAK